MDQDKTGEFHLVLMKFDCPKTIRVLFKKLKKIYGKLNSKRLIYI